MCAMLTCLVVLLADPSVPADLKGKVTGTDGLPVAQATVTVYSAAPKKGAATMGKYEYPECGRSALADPDGAFTIAAVDSSLNYELLVTADGYRPLMLKKVDPARGEIRAKLTATPKEFETAPLRGHITNANGDPVAGARIEPFGARDGTQRWWGGTSEVCENGTYTDVKGEFLLLTKKENVQIDIRVWPRDRAPQSATLLSPGDQVNEISITPGASITGRVVKDGQPLSGITVRLVQVDRGMEHYIGDFDAVTDDTGKFTFKHVMPNDQYYLYATMKSLAEHGAMTMQQFSTTGDETTTDAGDLAVENGSKLSGQLFCSDDKPVPSGIKATLSRWNASDSIDVTVDKEGKFEFKNVPADLYEFYVRANGYHISADNESFEPANARFLLGRVDQDIEDLRVQLDPGPDVQHNYNGNKWQTLQNSQLSGVPKQ